MKTLQLLLFVPFLGIAQQVTLTAPEKLFSETVHWNSQSAVKNQGARNTCSAFGVAAALETFDGVPKDLSEKYLYAIQKVNDFIANKKTTDGQYLSSYPNALITDGVITETELPYDPAAIKKWHVTDSELSRALDGSGIGFVNLLKDYRPKAKIFLSNYEYLDLNPSKNIEYIKSQLKNGIKAIPVSYKIYQPAWKTYRSAKFNTITPDSGYTLFGITGEPMSFMAAKNLFPNDVAEKILNGELKYVQSDPDAKQYGYHVVTIIGYDEKGFIIKNSWSQNWRFNGYERVSFDFHKLFAYEALLIKNITIKN